METILARQIAHAVQEAGGRACYVGGCVRDKLMGRTYHDLDIEVYGLEKEKLKELLGRFGTVTETGEKFGIYGLKDTNLDIALPRTERRTGAGHKDFEVTVDPFLSVEEAVLRRDFTVNAMLEDVLTGEIIDPANGRADMEKRELRCVRAATFPEDGLRVFRAAQFAARFGYTVEKDTLELCRGMDVTSLPKERVFAETEKALLEAETPSVFFRVLESIGHLAEFFPEVKDCRDVPQNPAYHPEGDVFEHTMRALDCAASLRTQAKKPLAFMLSVLVHDLGKCVCTVTDENGRITSHRHETLGIPLVETQIRRLSGDRELLRYAVNQTELHMRPNLLAGARSHKKKTRMLFDESVCPEDLILLAHADAGGMGGRVYPEEYTEFLTQRLKDYRDALNRPMLTGDDLRAAGFLPGKGFGDVVKRARALHFSGLENKNALEQLKRDFPELLK